MKYLCLATVVATLIFSTSVFAGAFVGFNVENPQWVPDAKLDEMLGHMKAAGVKRIRFPFEATSGRDYGPVTRFTERAYKQGIKSSLILFLQYPADAPKRPAVPNTPATWPMPGLSSADPALFKATFQPIFDLFDKEGLTLAGIELGNEINWPQYNGDIPVPGTGKTFSLENLKSDPEGQKVAEGFRRYIASLAALKDLRDRSQANRSTPIVLGGLVDISPTSPPPEAMLDDVNISTSIAYLRSQGLDALVDGYGVHTSAGVGTMFDDEPAKKRLSDFLSHYVLSACRPAGVGKPCWITEWGLLEQSQVCPPSNSKLPSQISAFFGSLDPYIREGSVTGLIYVNWSDDAFPYGVYRCNGLSEAGRLLISRSNP